MVQAEQKSVKQLLGMAAVLVVCTAIVALLKGVDEGLWIGLFLSGVTGAIVIVLHSYLFVKNVLACGSLSAELRRLESERWKVVALVIAVVLSAANHILLWDTEALVYFWLIVVVGSLMVLVPTELANRRTKDGGKKVDELD
ncbi:hypothetical protein KQH82_06755 [bacterium]|nr:hypothetical protein [bacterium]